MHIAMLGVKGIPHPGGIENVVEQLGSRLVERGHQVTVYVRPHYTPRTQKKYRGMDLVHLPSISTKSLDAFTHTTASTLAVLVQGADIVHIHSIGLSVFAAPLRASGFKTVVTSHGLDWQRKKWGRLGQTYLKFSDYTTVRLPDATTVVSRKMQDYYQAKFKRPITYIPNGVNAFETLPPDKIRALGLQGNDYILFAARLVPEKGCHYLIEAYRRLAHPSKKLVVVGDENYQDRYASELKKNANENIFFLGFVRGQLLQELLSNAYLYVLPSEIEGLSTGLLEALAYGNCVVVSDIAENLEPVGESGVSFRSKDVDDLTDKLADLLAAPEKVECYRRQSKTHVLSQYNWDRVTDQYEAIYSNTYEP